MPKVGKPKSKRTPVRLRHKIEKASTAKQRKARRAAKQNPEWRSRLKKDPGIPNLFPYKDKILAEIEEGRRRKDEDRLRRREEARAARTGAGTGIAPGAGDPEQALDADDVEGADGLDHEDSIVDEMEDVDDDANPMAALLASARAAAAEYEEELGTDSESNDDGPSEMDSDEDGAQLSHTQKDGSRRAFDKIFKQVVDQADVVLYVLDARDPEGTRSKEVERSIMAAANGSKRLILILNKIDLIPPPVLKAWLLHLRRYFPTLPLRASGPAANAHTFNHKQLTVQSTSATLFRALKSYAASKQLKRAISVGVIGYPNVGKSSVINALASRLGSSNAACPTGAEAGVTTALRQVKLDNKLKLLDSPGIVFPSSTSASVTLDSSSRDPGKARVAEQARLVLLNAVPPKQIVDPIPAVTLLLERLSASPALLGKLMAVYGLPPLLSDAAGDATTDFLVQVARRRGRMGKGGVPNVGSAAMAVITDWRDGRIQGWVDAPVLAIAGTEGDADAMVTTETEAESSCRSKEHGGGGGPMPDQKTIVTEWAAEFKLEGLWGDGGKDVDEDGDGDGDGDEAMKE